MNYPDFFDFVKPIKLYDPLSEFLGTFENGIVEFSYLDIVKNSGHSCPTVAGAYLMMQSALQILYKDEIPKRGDILIEFSNNELDGVTGVIANVFTQISGATKSNGFKGLNGKFSRVQLMEFSNDLDMDVRFTRTDTHQSVQISYDPSSIGIATQQKDIMNKCIKNLATDSEVTLFKELWQERVKTILENPEKVLRIQE